jgi:hypothetical protein
VAICAHHQLNYIKSPRFPPPPICPPRGPGASGLCVVCCNATCVSLHLHSTSHTSCELQAAGATSSNNKQQATSKLSKGRQKQKRGNKKGNAVAGAPSSRGPRDRRPREEGGRRPFWGGGVPCFCCLGRTHSPLSHSTKGRDMRYAAAITALPLLLTSQTAGESVAVAPTCSCATTPATADSPSPSHLQWLAHSAHCPPPP